MDLIHSIKNHGKKMEYIPIMLIALLFIAEEEMDHHLANTSCQLVISLLAVICFIVIVGYFGCSKKFAIFLICILWFFLVYTKRCYLHRTNL